VTTQAAGLQSAGLLRNEVLPFVLAFIALGLAALSIDAVLHIFDSVWIGRYLGIPGVVLILGSFAYSLRKRKLITVGSPVQLLRLHERMTWLGSLLVLVHAGIHFNSILGWLAVWAMLINVGSGLTGKYLLARARKRMEATRLRLRGEGQSAAEVEDTLYWDGLTFDAVKQWRRLHIPITLAFATLAVAHIISVLLFWAWPLFALPNIGSAVSGGGTVIGSAVSGATQ